MNGEEEKEDEELLKAKMFSRWAKSLLNEDFIKAVHPDCKYIFVEQAMKKNLYYFCSAVSFVRWVSRWKSEE